ncbi:O-methyltransferase ZRP4 isoform X2 [Panicum miliaceum]|uniref:O-methyltransferase ZRP4 isoform X2 n=1 Tax=Panicum miliaceum TaxID=4540 RepID=A0A3L6PLB2_PANMI|nr:O-methyltransferase ZRP4 isoform X2 [Panicum miliaceum]
MDALHTEDLIHAESVLYHHFFCYVKSMALSCAVHLGIPNAIYHRGGSATLSDLIAGTGLHASTLPCLKRLVNVLTISGIFTASNPPATGSSTTGSLSSREEVVYKLATMSRLLITGDDNKLCSMSPMLHFLVRPLTVTPFFGMHSWFKDEQAASKSFFEMAHGCDRWEMTSKNAEDNGVFNEAMVADSQLVMEIFLREAGGKSFSGISSLVNVGGGLGGASAAITRTFPHIKCTVLDLPHVVSQASSRCNGTVHFVAGDMFEFIPRADAVLLKILRLCKAAIPAREDGGKVIIIDCVTGSGPQDPVSKETHALYDLYMMYINGVERGENDWKKIFQEAGFSGYKIVPGLGIRSAIEVYP